MIDLGGGPLGNRGRNRFVTNGGVDSVSNANVGTAAIGVDAAGNYRGGGPPVMAPAAPGRRNRATEAQPTSRSTRARGLPRVANIAAHEPLIQPTINQAGIDT